MNLLVFNIHKNKLYKILNDEIFYEYKITIYHNLDINENDIFFPINFKFCRINDLDNIHNCNFVEIKNNYKVNTILTNKIDNEIFEVIKNNFNIIYSITNNSNIKEQIDLFYKNDFEKNNVDEFKKEDNNFLKIINKNFCVHHTYYQNTEHRGGWNIVKKSLNGLINQNSDTLFLDNVDGYFLWGDNQIIYKKWFGFLHLTPYFPNHLNHISIDAVFSNRNFLESLKNCKFLLSLSNYLTSYLMFKLTAIDIKINVYTILHPTDICIQKFSIDDYKNNNEKKLIQIGQQLRKITSIYRVKTNYTKIWLTGFRDQNRIQDFLNNEINIFKYKDIKLENVEMKYLNSFNEYDELLTKNIVFIDFYDATANNTVVECIARNTPLLVNKVGGTLEYLGKNYPLYFDNLDEIDSLLNIDNIEKAYNYLKNLNKDYLDINNFKKKFIDIINLNL